MSNWGGSGCPLRLRCNRLTLLRDRSILAGGVKRLFQTLQNVHPVHIALVRFDSANDWHIVRPNPHGRLVSVYVARPVASASCVKRVSW
jgi:hypothetical protein